MRGKFVFALLFITFLLEIVSSSFIFSEDESSINNKYEVSGYLKAQINISFQNESISSTFRDSVGNEIKLWELLDVVPSYAYTYNDSTKNTIDSKFQILDLSYANFSMPSTVGNITYILTFNGTELFKEKIRIVSTDLELEKKIEESYAKINSLKTEIKNYDIFTQDIVNKFLNMTSLEKNLSSINNKYEKASTTAEYDQLLLDLSALNIPKEISLITETNSITFYPEREKVNLDIVGGIDGAGYGENEEEYIDAIYFWNEENLKTKITFKEMRITYDTKEVELNLFQFEFDKGDLTDQAYFIIEDIANLTFEKDYSPVEESGYFYININDLSENIAFSTTENVNFIDIPAFISPSLDDLNITKAGNYPSSDEDKKFSKWLLFTLIVILLILIAVVVYISIQIWYKRKYENYLFKNRNNLYNIMTYIQTSKKRGMGRDEIMANLKKANWTREQINYALRKYEGKKIIGIIETPFKKLMEDVDKKSKRKI